MLKIEAIISEETMYEIAKMTANILKSESEAIPKADNTVFGVDEIAKITGLNKQTITEHLRRGLLNGTKIGKKWTVTQENLTKYIDKK